jgi:hypothetical protein
MRPILSAAAAMIGAASVLASTDAMAQFYPGWWPGVFGPGLYGPGFYGPPPARLSTVRKKPVSTKQASTKQASTKQASTKQASTKQASTKQASTKHVSTKQVSSTCPAATAGISTGPALRPVIPLPDQELLTPQPEFDCEFKTSSVDDANDQPEPSPTRAQADPITDSVLRKKLEYERECYRHAEIVLRDRLRLLQVSVGETIKAAIFGPTKTEAPKEPR